MDRRAFTVLGVLVLFAGVYTFGIQITRWEASLHSTEPGQTDSFVNSSDLPPECQRLSHALAAGQTVSMKGYRFQSHVTTVIVKKTTLSEGWQLGNVSCMDPEGYRADLEFSTIRDNGQYYNIDGYYGGRSGCPIFHDVVGPLLFEEEQLFIGVFEGCVVFALLRLSLFLVGGGLVFAGRSAGQE